MQVTKGLSTKYGREPGAGDPHLRAGDHRRRHRRSDGRAAPVAEIMIMDFLAVCADQLVNHAAKLRFMSGGRTNVPLTVRCLTTGGFQMGAQHSQSLEAWLSTCPAQGGRSRRPPADAKGLLTACIRDDDPCVFIEPAALYGATGPGPGRRARGPAGPGRREAAGVRRDARHLRPPGPRLPGGRRASSRARSTSRCSTCAPSSRWTPRPCWVRWPRPAGRWSSTRPCGAAAFGAEIAALLSGGAVGHAPGAGPAGGGQGHAGPLRQGARGLSPAVGRRHHRGGPGGGQVAA